MEKNDLPKRSRRKEIVWSPIPVIRSYVIIMKKRTVWKSLMPAVAVTLGIAFPLNGQAANPFADVPAGHWAYESIAKLAAAGVVEGYGDDTFRGDRLMTRYEMAQIVAKALAKGANVDRLSAEFAEELEGLGVRVTSLEKKADNVQVTGEVYYYYANSNHAITESGKKYENELRTRLYVTGAVNDNWKYVGRLENRQHFNDNVGNEKTEFNVAKLEGRLGGLKVTAGADDDEFGEGCIYDGEHDAVKVTYGDKFYVSGAYGKLTEINEDSYAPAEGEKFAKRFWNAEVGTKTDGFVNGKFGYLNTKLDTDGKTGYNGKDDLGIWYAGLGFNLTDDLGLSALYLKGSRDKIAGGQQIDDDGLALTLSYKGAEEAKPGSWGLTANYYRQGKSTYLLHTIDGYTDFKSGFKGWSVGGELTVAKNMVMGINYYDTRPMKTEIDGKDSKTRVLWSDFTITF